MAVQNVTPDRNFQLPLESNLVGPSVRMINQATPFSPFGAGYNLLPDQSFGQIYMPGPNATLFGNNPFGVTPFGQGYFGGAYNQIPDQYLYGSYGGYGGGYGQYGHPTGQPYGQAPPQPPYVAPHNPIRSDMSQGQGYQGQQPQQQQPQQQQTPSYLGSGTNPYQSQGQGAPSSFYQGQQPQRPPQPQGQGQYFQNPGFGQQGFNYVGYANQTGGNPYGYGYSQNVWPGYAGFGTGGQITAPQAQPTGPTFSSGGPVNIGAQPQQPPPPPSPYTPDWYQDKYGGPHPDPAALEAARQSYTRGLAPQTHGPETTRHYQYLSYGPGQIPLPNTRQGR